MAKKPLGIHVDMDKKCKGCGEGGATQSGYCLGCVAKGIKEGKFDHIIKPIKDVVKYTRRPKMAKKIVIKTKIKTCNIKSNGEGLTFDAVSLTDDQRNDVIDMVKNKEVVRLSFEPIQEKLPTM